MLNKKKRNLELTGAIFSIVLGAFGLLGVLVLSMSTNLIKEYPQFADLDLNFINVILVCLIPYFVAIIVLASLLCKSPIKKDGTIKKRFGLQLTLVILIGVELISTISNIASNLFTFAFCACPFVLLIISMCLKHPTPVNVDETPTNDDFYNQ